MSKAAWNYNGDINLEYGGFYWREDGSEDYVLVVRVTPCSDAGGPDNLYHIEQGSLYMPEDADRRRRALDCCGYELATATRSDIVDAFMAYGGIDRAPYDGEHVVSIGKYEPNREWSPKPDIVLRANASLRRYVEREYLSC